MFLHPPHERAPTSGSKEPAQCDILCGKDKTFNKHYGNRIFRHTISAFQDAYAKAANKQLKMSITKEIVQKLRAEHGARFVKLQKGQWQEISEQMARDKVSHALRFAAKGGACCKKIRVGKPGPLGRCLERASNTVDTTSICCGTESSSSSVPTNAGCDRRSHTSDGDEDAVVESLFDRQRLILKSLRFDEHLEEEIGSSARIASVIDRAISLQMRSDAVLSSFSGRRACQTHCSSEFDSLRSEDIEGLMGEGLDLHTSQEWALDISQ